MTQEYKLLIDALAIAVAGQNRALHTDVDWPAFLQLCDSHKLTALVCDGIQKTPGAWEQIPEQYGQYLNRAYMQAIFRDAQMEHTQQILAQGLTQANIAHVFLKGIVLKHAYPMPALRTMSDMDLLVYAKDFEIIDQVAQTLGAKSLDGDGNHRNYLFPGKVAVEFHPNLLHHATPIGTDINPGWQYARNTAGGSWELTEEGFYLNTLCHMAHHFAHGGVGVRFVLDIWVNRHLRKPEADWKFVETELERFGLSDFANKIQGLSECWFGTAKGDELMEELGEYILTSGSHGREDRAILNTVSLSPGGNRRSALWRKVFYPRAELEDRFPWCRGKTWLLPAAWCTRAFKALTTHGKQIRQWSKGSGQVSDQAAAEQKEKLQRFGIHNKSKEEKP